MMGAMNEMSTCVNSMVNDWVVGELWQVGEEMERLNGVEGEQMFLKKITKRYSILTILLGLNS